MAETIFRSPVGAAPVFVPDTGQRAVLELPEGRSAAVLGAPGTGKTETLLELVADRILTRGYAPDEVLVLTPTRAGATDLRDRIAVRIGVPTPGPVARSVASVAFEYLALDARDSGAAPPRLLTGPDQDRILADLVAGEIEDGTDDLWPASLGVETRSLRGFRTQLRELLAACAERGVAPEHLAQRGRAEDRPAWIAAARLFGAYGDVLARARVGHFDSTELVLEAVARLDAAGDLRAPGALGSARLVVVDDAQEFPLLQLQLLRSLQARGARVIAFGDPDISVGSFRGARADALGALAGHLGIPASDLDTVVLDTVYRHGSAVRTLVARTTALIGTAGAGRQRRGSARADAGPGRVLTVRASSPADQGRRIARILRERHVFDGLPWERMAVVVRSGSQVPALERALAAAEVPVAGSTAPVVLRDTGASRALLDAFGVAVGAVPVDEASADALLSGPLGGLDRVALRRLRAALLQEELAAGGARTGAALLAEALRTPGVLAALDTSGARRVVRLARSLATASAEAAAGASVEEILWGLWERSGLAASWSAQSEGTGVLADEAHRALDAVVALFGSAERFVEREPTSPPRQFFDDVLASDLPEDRLTPRQSAGAVAVGTPAALVGRDAALVVVAGLQDGVWPDLRVRGTLLDVAAVADPQAGTSVADERRAVLHDELRLFARAVSRATDEVVLAAVDDEDGTPSPLFALGAAPEAPNGAPGPNDAGSNSAAGPNAAGSNSAAGPNDAAGSNSADGPAEPGTDGAAAVVSGDRHPLTLRGLVGALRRELTAATATCGDSAAPDSAASAAAAAALARLAAERVPGADPAEWDGLRQPSRSDPLGGGGIAAVRPSGLEKFERCGLDWVVSALGGDRSSAAANLGTVVHGVVEAAPEADAETLFEGVRARWGELQWEAPWHGEAKLRTARAMTRKVAEHNAALHAEGGRVVAVERPFDLVVGETPLRGAVDRIEWYPGRNELVIVDLKTGTGVAASDVPEHAQLLAYQFAFLRGGLDPDDAEGSASDVSLPAAAPPVDALSADVVAADVLSVDALSADVVAADVLPAGARLAGAAILAVGTGTVKAAFWVQPALEPDAVEAFAERVQEASRGMAGPHFTAAVAAHCTDPHAFGDCSTHIVKAVSHGTVD